MYGPVLTGTKVTLRPPDDSDAARVAAWFADLEVTRYLNRRFTFAVEQEEGFLKSAGESKTDVFWMLEAEGQAIGTTGIYRIDWLNARATTGTMIGVKSEWGKGRGSEAMALRTEYAFRQLNLHKLTSGTYLENEPSKRALMKAGYREVGIEHDHYFRGGRWHDHWMCEVLRDDWERMQAP